MPLPEPNAAFACGRVGRNIVVIGGTNWAGGRKNWLRSVHNFDPEKLRWTTLAPLEQPLAHPVMGEFGDGMIVAGGTMGERPFTGALWMEKSRTVITRERGIATPAVLCAGGLIGDKLILVGGTDSASNPAGFRREVFSWDMRTHERSSVPLYPGPAFGVGSAAVLGDELLVFGGCRFEASEGKVANLADAYAFSFRRNEWRTLQSMPYAVRALTSVRLDERYAYLAGGARNEPEGFTDAAFLYDLVTNRYWPASSLPYRAALVGLVLEGEYVYCIAGEDRAQHRSDAVHRIKRTELLAAASG